MTYTLILLRHGESEWNAKNLFTGWVDVPLNDKGWGEAKRGGELLKDAGVLPDVVHTSLLRRAIMTANLALDAADRHWIPVKRDWRLNERHYGDLQGKNKAETLEQFGEEKFMIWRRSYDVPPPADLGRQPVHAGGRRALRRASRSPPRSASRTCSSARLPYWESAIVPDLKAGKTVMVAAHGNSLRAIIKYLDGIADDAIVGVNVPTGIPLVYHLDENLKPTNPGGTYLDPEAAAAAIQAVANQGKK